MKKHLPNVNFPHILESELFKLYFTAFDNINENAYNINLHLLNGTYKRNISSITYIIQFLSKGKVVEEVSIICTYKEQKIFKLTLAKHMINNNYSEIEMKEIHEGTRIGFPESSYIFSENMILSFTRIHDNNFLISLVDENKQNKRLNIGILSFDKLNNQRIDIETVVKCIIKTNSNITLDNMKKLFFILNTPTINFNKIKLNLTKKYIVSLSYDKKNNIIHVFDIGVVTINFNRKRATVYSLTSKPKTKMYVNIKQQYAINKYSFSNYQAVY